MELSKENEQIRIRKEKLEKLQKDHAFNYPNHYQVSHTSADLYEAFDVCSKEDLEKKQIMVSVAGRVKAIRNFGKASFMELQDRKGSFQLYVKVQDLKDPDALVFYQQLDIGDIVAASGFLFKTKTHMLSLHCETFTLLSKSLRPFPEKYHGIADVELKYRQRYLDLIMDPHSRQVFQTRSKIVDHLRVFFKQRDYMEVETPMMHPIAGGAAARPFMTHHNALDLKLSMRIAPELYLKRLVIGGFERIFEINRNFRNEGISTRHNPEFTMIEFYQAYATYEDLMELMEALFNSLAQLLVQKNVIAYQGMEIDFGVPWQRLKVEEGVRQFSQYQFSTRDPDAMLHYIKVKGYPFSAEMTVGHLLMVIFDHEVVPLLIQPTFVTHYPLDVSPLSRKSDKDAFLVDRFELFIAGREIANAFSELNDPMDQKMRFEAQLQAKINGDLEACDMDLDYIMALEYGLAPTAGAGIGVDRLTMLFTNAASIRDVILFPLMKPVL